MKSDKVNNPISQGSTTTNFFSATNINNITDAFRSNRQFSAGPKMLMKQSPKITSGKIRPGTRGPEFNKDTTEKLFSQLDIPINKIATGTKLPQQYIKRDEEELQKIFNGEEPINDLKQNEETKQFSKTANNFFTTRNTNHNTAYNKFIPDIPTINDMKESRPDSLKPGRFSEYERLVKTSHTNRHNPNFPIVNAKEIKSKMQSSDVFFRKKDNQDIIQCSHSKQKALDYQDSDIFNHKNNLISNNKSGEPYMIKDPKKVYYSITSKSNSEWHTKNSVPTLLNYTSAEYHLLNPGIKNISKTKKDIVESAGMFNPTYRQKSICEFIDLTRVGVPNPNKEYLQAFNKAKFSFGRNTNLCGSYLNVHRMYKNMSDRPFVKKIF